MDLPKLSCPVFTVLGTCQQDVSYGYKREADGAHWPLFTAQGVSMRREVCPICRKSRCAFYHSAIFNNITLLPALYSHLALRRPCEYMYVASSLVQELKAAEARRSAVKTVVGKEKAAVRLLRQVLCLPASSAAAERSFSYAQSARSAPTSGIRDSSAPFLGPCVATPRAPVLYDVSC